MSDDLVLLEEKDGVGTLTLNRPEKLNAMSPLVLAAFDERLAEAARDDAIKVLVIRGAGRSFSSGYRPHPPRRPDPRGRPTAPASEPGALAAHPRPAQTGDRHDPRPLPRGWRTQMCVCCDVIFTADDARIGFPSIPAGAGLIAQTWMWHVGPQPRQVHVVPSRQPDIGQGRRGVRLRHARLRPRRARSRDLRLRRPHRQGPRRPAAHSRRRR